MTNLFTQQMQDAADKIKNLAPQVTFNKNGYEIRAQMLEMAHTVLLQDYHAKWGAFQASITKDGNDVVTKVEMPTMPGVDQILAAAEKFYEFVRAK